MTKYNNFLKLLFVLIFSNVVFSNDSVPIPSDRSQINNWFQQNIQYLGSRRGTIDPVLETAQATHRVIRVRTDGSGDFRTIKEAVANISVGNSVRVIIDIGPGTYKEQIRIERTKRFVTLYGNPNNPPVITHAANAAQVGTWDSATFITEADYFMAVNIVFENTAPRPVDNRQGMQAVAFRISGDKAAMYGCKFHGFQDTVCDDMGKHFFKDCYIEGTVDFVFGNGKSIYLNCELHVIPGDHMAMVSAQARHNGMEDVGYSFVHCKVTGGGPGIAFLGRAWMPYSTTAFIYCELGDVVHPEGWFDSRIPERRKTVYFAEYSNTGPGADPAKRAAFTNKLNADQAKRYLMLSYIEGSKWLLPPIHP